MATDCMGRGEEETTESEAVVVPLILKNPKFNSVCVMIHSVPVHERHTDVMRRRPTNICKTNFSLIKNLFLSSISRFFHQFSFTFPHFSNYIICEISALKTSKNDLTFVIYFIDLCTYIIPNQRNPQVHLTVINTRKTQVHTTAV